MSKKEGLWSTLFGSNKRDGSCCQMEIVEDGNPCCTNTTAPTDNAIENIGELNALTSVKVLGPGCKSCHTLLENVQAALKSLNITVPIDYVTDMAMIASYGILSTPALMVNDKVISTGRVLKVADVIKLLQTLGI